MKKIIALAVAAVVAAPAMADLTIGGSARYQAAANTYTAQESATAAAKAAAAYNKAAADVGAVGGAPAAGSQTAASTSDWAAETNRVLVSFAGSTTAESGLFVSASATLQMTGDAGVSRDGDNALTIGNSAANVVLGAFEPAGAFSSGADAFQNGAMVASTEGSLRAREASNVGLNITAVEGLTLQLSTDMHSTDNVRGVVGYDFGMVKATAAYESVNGGSDVATATVGTTLGGVALNASYGESATGKSVNVNASYMGFSLAVQNDELGAAEEQEVYAAYALANAGGLEGLTVTVGAGDSDAAGVDTRYGVRLDYAF